MKRETTIYIDLPSYPVLMLSFSKPPFTLLLPILPLTFGPSPYSSQGVMWCAKQCKLP